MPVSVDASDLTRLVRKLGSVARNTPREFSQTIKSVGRASRTETKRAASDVYNTTKTRIDKGLRVDTTADTVIIGGKKNPLTLASFKPKAIGRRKKGRSNKGQAQRVGAIVTIIKQNGVKRLARKVFWVGKLPFERIGDRRYPIAPVPAPSVADMLIKPSVFTPLQQRLVLRARNELDRRITRALKNRG